MTVWRCKNCSGMWGLALMRCPRCHEDDWDVEEGLMPKASRAAGASNAGGVRPDALVPVEENQGGILSAEVAERINDVVEGGELPSVGSSSGASSEKPPLSSRKSGRGSRKPARTTENPSEGDQTGSSTAPSMDGVPETGTSAPDGD